MPGPLGVHFIVDAGGCPAEPLRDGARITELLSDLVNALDLHPLGAPALHRFPEPGGITAFLMLSESHVAVHTFPEHGALTLDVYCCRPRPPIDWAAILAGRLGAGTVSVRCLARGGPA